MKTLVTFLLDRTGSMQMIKTATIESFNGYLEGLRAPSVPLGDNAIDFTLLTFDSTSLDKICVAEPIAKVQPLNEHTYQPRAATPLIDACVKTIRAVEKSLLGRADKPQVVVCFQTDGEENSSTEHSWDQLTRLIKDKTAEGWQFNFLGVGIDAYSHAARMGIHANATISARPDARSMGSVFAASASNTRKYADGLLDTTQYSNKQRMAAGDPFADKHAADLDLDPKATNEAKSSIVDEPEL